MVYAIPYLLLFCFLLYLYKISKNQYRNVSLYESVTLRQSNIYEKLAVGSYLLFYGLRGYMFTDIFQYHEFYESINDFEFNWSYTDFNFEPGYVLCNIVIHYFSSNPFFFQFVWTAIDVVLLYHILKHETGEYFLLSFAFLIPLFDGVQINLLRNIKGILLFFYAIRFIRSKHIWKYVICILAGTLIHISTIIFLPFYFFVNKDMHKIMIVLSGVAMVLYFSDLSFLNLFFLFLSQSFGGKVDAVATSYVESTTSAGITIGFLYRAFILFILLIKYKKLKQINIVLLNISFFYIISNTAFNSILVMRDRFAALFAIGLIGILPFIGDVIQDKVFRKVFVFINMVCLLGFVYNPHSTVVAKYSNVITGVEDRKAAQSRVDSYIANHER